MQNSTLENALYSHALELLSKLKYGPFAAYGYIAGDAFLLNESRNVLKLAEENDIQNGAVFELLASEIEKFNQ